MHGHGPGPGGPGMGGPGMRGPGMGGPGMGRPGMRGPGMRGPGMGGPGMHGDPWGPSPPPRRSGCGCCLMPFLLIIGLVVMAAVLIL